LARFVVDRGKSLRESSGGNPLATWRTIATISCTISPRAPL
jgi:hypothetical protein